MRIAGFLILIFLAACSSFDPNSGEVTARTVAKHVGISNGTADPVYFIVIGRNAAQRALIGQHLSPDWSVGPGKQKWVSYDVFLRGARREDEAVVMWWHVVERNGERTAGQMHHVFVTL